MPTPACEASFAWLQMPWVAANRKKGAVAALPMLGQNCRPPTFEIVQF
jgi:hypothetical protein